MSYTKCEACKGKGWIFNGLVDWGNEGKWFSGRTYNCIDRHNISKEVLLKMTRDERIGHLFGYYGVGMVVVKEILDRLERVAEPDLLQ